MPHLPQPTDGYANRIIYCQVGSHSELLSEWARRPGKQIRHLETPTREKLSILDPFMYTVYWRQSAD
jgi:hypothetical protein